MGIKNKNTIKIQNSLELTLWLIIIAGLIFANLSILPFMSKQNLLSMLIVIDALLMIAIDRICSRNFKRDKRFLIELPVFIFLIFILHIVYKYVNLEYILLLSPVVLAFSLSTIVVLETRLISIGLVAVTVFLLGDAYWGGKLPQGSLLSFPLIFLRIFSLSLVILFGFYLYRKRGEAVVELEKKNQQLNYIKEKLEKRTEELTKLNERLKDLDALKSDFVSTVSHELKTPLTAIYNSTDLLKKIFSKEEIEDERLKELTDIIIKNTKRQKNMVNNLLDLSRIEKGEMVGDRKKFDIENVLDDVIKTLKHEADNKSLNLDVRISSNAVSIWGVPEQIERVFINIIDNAIEHSYKDSDIIIDIRKEYDNIKCSVRDFGPGIEKEEKAKIFDKFLQGKDSKSKGKGIGLGLSICKDIIDAHGGEIWVESEKNEGSKFVFKLPIDLRGKRKNEG